MAIGGNSRPQATRPSTQASAQRQNPPNVGKYDELQRLLFPMDWGKY